MGEIQINCYKASNMEKTILNSTKTANFKDRYILKAQLGWGKFGIIRACTDKLTGEILACKSIAKERLITEEDIQTVKLEIEIMSHLSGHLNIVDLKAVYEEEDYVHLLMELCEGGELFHQIEKKGRFNEYEARNLFNQLMKVVLYCHNKGIVHRDLKPENILLDLNCSCIKLADFGLASYINPGEKLNGTVGSPFYIAPEVLLSGGYNKGVDIWSAGVILYILLSGTPPFWGRTKSIIFEAVRNADLKFNHDLWAHVSESAKDLIKNMLCVDPDKRFTANQVLSHSWMNQSEEEPQESFKSPENSSFIAQVVPRDQDYSFTEEYSPVFTCKSSFSSFMVGPETPGPGLGPERFSFSSPIVSMPSFTFFSPGPTFELSDDSSSYKEKKSNIDEDSNSGKRFLFPNPTNLEEKSHEIEQKTEFRRQNVTNNGSKISSKRNHTIGLGELDQELGLIANESVIRWASCTHIPSPLSLRLSLVC